MIVGNFKPSSFAGRFFYFVSPPSLVHNNCGSCLHESKTLMILIMVREDTNQGEGSSWDTKHGVGLLWGEPGICSPTFL